MVIMVPCVALTSHAGLGLDGEQITAWSLCGALLPLLLSRHIWIGLALLAPFVWLAPLEAWYILDYGRPSDLHLYGILSETDWAESAAFMGGIGLPLALALCAAMALSFTAIRLAKAAGLAWKTRWRVTLCAVCLLVLSAPWLVDLASADALADPAAVQKPHDEGDEIAFAMDPLLASFASAYPSGVPWRIAEFVQQRRALTSLGEGLANFRFNAVPRAPVQSATGVSKRVHVLVIGETGRPDHWQINGYGRATSPRLSAEPNLVSFTDVVSPWAWTRMSVPVVLTRKPADDKRPFFAERSVITAFREAGYKAYWLSTQSPLGRHDSSFALHSHEADETRFLNAGNYKVAAAMDGDLLPALDRILARDEPRQLIVLHTLGSHYNYSHRYPAAFDIFKPSLKDFAAANLHDRGQRDLMVNAYDNSILYTDHVLAEVINRLQGLKAPATMLYVADHGENLFDGECKLSGHGRETERDFRVASFLWYSDAYQALAPDRVEQARQHRAAPLATTQFFYSMLDLGDVEIPGAPATNSFFQATMQNPRRRVQNGLDFDTAARDPVCKTLTAPPRSSAR
ncbi:MAG TPA: phosphoethanolamine transferase [Ideonella sp.]|nr:phosphoethanolamine transferase [Ideonella sp.]